MDLRHHTHEALHSGYLLAPIGWTSGTRRRGPQPSLSLPRSCHTKRHMQKTPTRRESSMGTWFFLFMVGGLTCYPRASNDPELWPQTQPHAAKMPGQRAEKEPLSVNLQLAHHSACLHKNCPPCLKRAPVLLPQLGRCTRDGPHHTLH